MSARGICLIVAVHLLALSSTPATAAAGPSAPAVPRFGPPVAGMCLFARKEALETSRSGQAIARRVDGAQVALQQQIAAERTRIDGQLAALRANDSAQRIALFEQMNTISRFETDAQSRIREQTTVAYRAIEPRMEAALAQTITRRGCAIIVEREITYGWNSQMDITRQVIETMDAGRTD